MKTEVTLNDLAAQVQERAGRKDDLVVPTPRLIMLNGSELSVPLDHDAGLGARTTELPVADIAHRQIGERLGIPAKFYESLRMATMTLSTGEKVPHEAVRQLLDTNVNTLFRERPEMRLLRTLRPREDGSGASLRAFLSDRYQPYDDEEIVERVVPILLDIPGALVRSCSLSDTRLYIKVVSPKVEGEVSVGDYVWAGVMIRNSEVGHGSLQVKPFVERLQCTNGMVVPEMLGEYLVTRHVGAKLAADETTYRIYSDETLEKDDAAFFSKVGDVVKHAVDETNFASIVAQMSRTKVSKAVADVSDAVERLAKRYTLSESEGKSVLQHLAAGGDLSQYGALNAITRTAEDVESYERATELETIGGELLVLREREWEMIAA